MKYIYLSFIFYFILFITRTIIASSPIIINEIQIEPNQTVELMNPSDTEVDISHWYLDDSGGTTYFTIPNDTIIYPHSCLTFSGEFNLNKSSADKIRLFDATAPPTTTNAMLIDSFSYVTSPGINNSFSRSPDAEMNWVIGTSSLGKYNSTSEPCITLPTPTQTATPVITLTPTQALTPTQFFSSPDSCSSIYISEVLPYPNTNEHEWVELYNHSDFDCFLQNWYLDDAENSGASPKQFSLTVTHNSYVSYDLNSSMFNNDGDIVRLLDFNKNERDSLEYSLSTKNISWGRVSFDDNSFCEQEPSKNTVNNPCVDKSETPTLTSSTTTNVTVTTKPSITKTPTKTPTPKKTPTSLIKHNQAKMIDTSYSAEEEIDNQPIVDVLGASTQNTDYENPNALIVRIFAGVSFICSLLTIVIEYIRIRRTIFNM